MEAGKKAAARQAVDAFVKVNICQTFTEILTKEWKILYEVLIYTSHGWVVFVSLFYTTIIPYKPFVAPRCLGFLWANLWVC